jgi:hypothetical protein
MRLRDVTAIQIRSIWQTARVMGRPNLPMSEYLRNASWLSPVHIHKPCMIELSGWQGALQPAFPNTNGITLCRPCAELPTG